MKIAVYTNSYKPIVSGVVTAIALFRQGLIAQGHEAIVLAPDYYGYKDQEEGIYRYPSVDLTRKVRFPVAVPWCRRIDETVRKFKPDLIHSHHPFVLGPVALKMARRMSIPLVYTFHTQYEQYSHYVPLRQDFVKRMTRERIRRFANKADLVTTPAESATDLLRFYGVNREILVVPNPIDLSNFESQEGSAVRRQLGLDPEDLVTISIGRLGVEKNLGFMIEAFARMIALAPELPLRLILVGAGPDEARLRELSARLGLGERLVLAGSVPYLAVPSYLAAADLFLMSSVTEVKPLVLLEAMGAGLPIVAVRASGAIDTIIEGQEGLMTGLDQEEFAAAAVSLLRDRTRRHAMSENGKATVNRYSLDTVTAILSSHFAAAIAAKTKAKA